ncbi:MAG: hypothetical protein IJV31_05265 [Clostridia bacterium]|nr:hypothetical protein [Clostridia bacterium]
MEDKKIGDLLKELAELHFQNAIIGGAIKTREAVQGVNQATAEIKEEFIKKAQAFGVSAKKCEEIFSNNKESVNKVWEDYKEACEEVQENYLDRYGSLMKNTEELNKMETENYAEAQTLKIEEKDIKKSPEYAQFKQKQKDLKAEVKKALAKGDNAEVIRLAGKLKDLEDNNPLKNVKQEQRRNQEDRDAIKEMRQELAGRYDDLENERNEGMQKLAKDRNNALLALPKQNIFQKITGAIMNRIGGARKFKNLVEKQVSERISQFKEEDLPKLEEKMSEIAQAVEEKVNDVQEKVNGAKQSVKEAKEMSKGKVNEVKESAKGKINEVKESAKGNVNDIKNKAIGIGKDKIDKVIATAHKAQKMGIDTAKKVQTIPGKVKGKASQLKTAVEVKALTVKEQTSEKVKMAKAKAKQKVNNAKSAGKRSLKAIAQAGRNARQSVINELDSRVAAQQERQDTLLQNFDEMVL